MAKIIVLNFAKGEVINVNLTPQQVKLLKEEYDDEPEYFLSEVEDQLGIDTSCCQYMFCPKDKPIINKTVSIEI